MYTVDVAGTEQQRLFISEIGVFGPRVAQAERLVVELERTVPNPNVDTLPLQCFGPVREFMQARVVDARKSPIKRMTSYSGLSRERFSPTRALMSNYADVIIDPRLDTWVHSDVFWDRVVSIEECGEEEVFDLTVPGPASWLADCLVIHNSGAIEQDADLIMMIYREEVYEPDTPRKGIADIIITKQRNGPTGEVHLTFLGKYTRFENLAHGDYGGYGD
jgi:replicative DNA helicase